MYIYIYIYVYIYSGRNFYQLTNSQICGNRLSKKAKVKRGNSR